ncbi:MAG: dihydroneopterin aldolase [Candidatus Hydrogenedentes bacterium]|nr:dihydroneopterin aldolase [Candidatus Hydrogenedentota bacterium]
MNSAAMDKIYIRDLQVSCIVGIYPEERTAKQEVLINVVLETDLARACRSDDIADTVNYKEVKKTILRMVEASEFYLIERMADAIAAICLDTPGVQRTTVTVDKPGALRFARSVAVEIARSHVSNP